MTLSFLVIHDTLRTTLVEPWIQSTYNKENGQQIL